jgi:hypothetical protein
MRGGFQQYLFQLFAIEHGSFLAQQLQFELPRSDTLRNLNWTPDLGPRVKV